MRRLLILIGGLFGLLLLAGAGLCVFLATADLRSIVESRAAKDTGRAVSIGSLAVDWGRRTRVMLRDVKFGNAPWGSTPHMVQLGSLMAEFDLWVLLRGSMRYERLAAEKLTIVLERGPGHVGNWKLTEGSAGGDGLIPKNRTQVPTLMDFVLDEGVIIYRNAATGLELKVDATRFSLTAAGEEAPIHLTWRGGYNDIAATLEADGQSFTMLRRSDVPFGVDAKLTAGENRLAFQGTMMEPLDFEGVAGAVQGEILNLIALLDALEAGISFPARGRIEGRFERNGDRWLLREAKGHLADTAFEGDLTFVEAPRGKSDDLDLQLRITRLDLDKLMPKDDPKRPFAQTPLDLGNAGKINLAGRIAATEVVMAGWSASDLLVEGRRTEGNLAIDSLRLKALGGTVAASGTASRVPQGTKISFAGDVDRVRLEEAAKRFGADAQGMTGRVQSRFAIDSDGKTMGEALSKLGGHMVVTVSEGRAPRALIEKMSTDVRALFRDRAGVTEITCFLALLDIQRGIGQFVPFRLRTPEATVIAIGRVDFAQEQLDAIIATQQRQSSLFSLNIPLQVKSRAGQVSVAPLTGKAPAAPPADLSKLPASSRGLAEGNACLR